MTKDEALSLALEALTVLLDEWTPARQAQLKGMEAITAIKAALEAKDEPVACWCHKCNENELVNGIPFAMTRMILCPKCGNKRCPKASDHTLQCTNSNEPNQAGSVYTTPPQRKPLTDEEIDTIGATIFRAEFLDDTEVKSNHEFARAIEAAHGIKGEA